MQNKSFQEYIFLASTIKLNTILSIQNDLILSIYKIIVKNFKNQYI